MTDTTIGNNSGTLLKEIVDAIIDLRGDLVDEKEMRKAKVAEMKKYQLPVAELMRVANQDDTKVAEKAKAMQDAAGILGVQVYAGAITPEEPKEFDGSVIEMAREDVKSLQKLDENIDAINDNIREKLKEAKSAGFVPKFVNKVVDIKMDPNGFQSYDDESALITSYWNAVQ